MKIISLKNIYISGLVGLIFFALNSYNVSAQTVDFGIAYAVNIETDQQIQDGQIVSITNGGYKLTDIPYDRDIFGVIDLTPDLLLDITNGEENSYPIITNGQAYILVSTQEGEIQIGDWITTSTNPGVGVKADRDIGPIVGQALEAYTDTERPGLILGTVNIGEIQGVKPNPSIIDSLNELLLDMLRLTGAVATDKAFDLLRYIIAAIVIIIAIIFAYLTFGRIARSGVEAAGRNPLAKNTILTGIVFNIIMVVFIILSGIVVGYLILRL